MNLKHAGALVAAAASLIMTAPASAAVTVTQTDGPDPVATGQQVTYSITVTNTYSTPADLWFSALTTKPDSDADSGNRYLSLSASQGSCSVDPPGVSYSSGECTLGSVAAGASVQIQGVVQADHSMEHLATAFTCVPGNPGCPPTALSREQTAVTFPPAITGSPKIAVAGLPPGCADSDFVAIAKASTRSVRSISVSLSGPRDEWGGRMDGVVTSSGRIAKSKGRKVKAPVEAGKLHPGFYELAFLGLGKRAKLKTLVTFQVC